MPDTPTTTSNFDEHISYDDISARYPPPTSTSKVDDKIFKVQKVKLKFRGGGGGGGGLVSDIPPSPPQNLMTMFHVMT